MKEIELSIFDIPYTCGHCNTTFKSEKDCIDHIDKYHSNPKTYQNKINIY